ncbi:BCR, YceG family protein [Halovibrio salipaludis]|uniref:Endolytic murein transglycosylase n=1 Tax=Halovibrio salipaludis TaxID=2032626 RepID=A0A2A2F8Z8_9GAMM|nr:endolytic transglycosylase MltG [Halovibrio salipaludis]PAU81300.1 BCR, YceG family protein [Halovibrio salipaludis]
MRSVKRILGFTVLLAAVTAIAGWLFIEQHFQRMEEPLALEQPVTMEIERGTTLQGLARELEAQGHLPSAFWLLVRARLEPELAQLQSGVYQLEDGMSPLGFVRRVVAGDAQTWTVRIPEGWTFERVRARLAEADPLRNELEGMSGEAVMEHLGQPGMHPEGWFFPAVYEYGHGASDLDVLERAHDRMQRTLSRLWRDRRENLPLERPYEALILASIVELETPLSEEKPRVAGVFTRRLERGMRLQTDPTVIYGMGDGYQGRIGHADLREYTPYNTYRIDGLPPTPIGMPGEASLRAVVNPAEGEALYFVAKGNGSHHFSATLEEHNEAVRRYQLNRGEDYRSFPAPEGGTD